MTTPVVGRGAAYGDYDNDGDLDLLLTSNNGPARLLRNDGGSSRKLRVKLVGTASNRDAVGARVRVDLGGGQTQWRMVKTGSSYLSQSELPVTFGLGSRPKIEGIEVSWPGGKTERLPGVAADRAITIQEGKGVIANTPFGSKP